MLFVTGITGHTGRYFLQELIDHKYEGPIRCIVRETSDTSMLDNSGLNIEKVYGDLDDGDFLMNAMRDVDVLLHIAGIQKTLKIIKAATLNKVGQGIFVHTTGIFSKFKSASEEYQQIEDEMKRIIKTNNKFMSITILRPTMIYGDLENIIKIVSGMDEDSLDEISKVYELVIEVGVHRAGSIKVAEAAKVVENSQRDINIAFMNELAMVFDRMGIDTKEVVEAMNTKWNALGFTPGLVGGHCIGVDPYYFVYEAEKLGYHSQIILSGRKINDGMGKFVADAIIKKLILANKVVRQE